MRRILPFFTLILAVVGLVAYGSGKPAGAANQITTFTASGIGGPNGIVAGPDGNLWFVSHLGDKIGRITPAGAITLYGNALVDNSPPGTS